VKPFAKRIEDEDEDDDDEPTDELSPQPAALG
jgi:hypothetical protein